MIPLTLDRFTETTAADSVDCLIIGGGITGAALAYEAASRGYSVALVEKGDFGGATSAATGKLIHGGLRYLKQFEFSLVRESLRERRILSNIAPNLVYPFPIVMPRAGMVEKLGLTAYDLLSWDRNRVWDRDKQIPGFTFLTRAQTLAAAPKAAAPPKGRGIRFHDCLCISPERLTLAFVKSAAAAGARVANHAKAQRLILHRNRVLGAIIRDRITGDTQEIRARVTVNASGPWTHDLLNQTRETRTPLPRVRSEGLYFVTRKLTDQMFLVVGEHGHFSFAPWRGHSLIGPTDTPFHGTPDQWKISARSVETFLQVINRAAGLREQLTRKDIKFVYGGLRPLAETGGDNTYNASRRSDLYDHDQDGIQGLITAAGGKYTTSREFAVQIFSRVMAKVGRTARPSVSHRRYLFGCGLPGVEDLISSSQTAFPRAGVRTLDYLVRHYGQEHTAVLDLAAGSRDLAAPVNADGEILAQVLFALRHEMARSLEDIFFRRTGLGCLGHPGDRVIQAAADLAARELGWTPGKKSAEIQVLNQRFVIP